MTNSLAKPQDDVEAVEDFSTGSITICCPMGSIVMESHTGILPLSRPFL